MEASIIEGVMHTTSAQMEELGDRDDQVQVDRMVSVVAKRCCLGELSDDPVKTCSCSIEMVRDKDNPMKTTFSCVRTG